MSLLTAVSSTILAASVYLNGVNIDGVHGQKFEKATVTIDDKGNVLIDAPNYTTRAVLEPPDKAAKVSAGLSKRYWLVTEQTELGMTEYDVDVSVNAKWFRKLKNQDSPTVLDLTPALTPGKNTVLFSARKVSVGARRSRRKDHVFRVVVGEGEVWGGDRVKLQTTLAKFERTAEDTEDGSQEFVIHAK